MSQIICSSRFINEVCFITGRDGCQFLFFFFFFCFFFFATTITLPLFRSVELLNASATCRFIGTYLGVFHRVSCCASFYRPFSSRLSLVIFPLRCNFKLPFSFFASDSYMQKGMNKRKLSRIINNDGINTKCVYRCHRVS